MPSDTTSPPESRHALAGTVRNVLEWYDFAILLGGIQGPLPAFMVECFPIRGRYTAIGLSYNITLAIFGGTAPLVSTWLVKTTGDLASPAIYLVVLAAISFVSMLFLKPIDNNT